MASTLADDIAEVNRDGHCRWCDCPVVSGNAKQHCRGSRHQRARPSLPASDANAPTQRTIDHTAAQRIIANGYRCSVCECMLPHTPSLAFIHVRGAAHRKKATAAAATATGHAQAPVQPQPPQNPQPKPTPKPQPQLQPKPKSQPQPQPSAHSPSASSSSSAQKPTGPSAAAASSSSSASAASSSAPLDDAAAIDAIGKSGRCKLCAVPVPHGATNAQNHVRGHKHQLQVKLGQVGWKEKFAQSQTEQEGVSLSMRHNDAQLEPGKTIQCEVDSSFTVSLFVHNRSNARLNVARMVGLPPLQLGQMGIDLRLQAAVLVAPGQSVKLRHWEVKPTAGTVGLHRCLVAVQLKRSKRPMLLLRAFDIHVVPRGASAEMRRMEQEAAARPFQPKPRQNAAHAQQSMNVVPGEAPEASVSAKDMYVRPLGQFAVPRPVPPLAQMLAGLSQPLNGANYYKRFCTLLQLEELQMCVDIKSYDRQSTLARDPKRPRFLRLSVPGLAESRPSVQKSDQILAAAEPFADEAGRPCRMNCKVYSGFVHLVEQEYVFLLFNQQFHSTYISGQKLYLRFTFNRIPLRRCHQGTQLIAQNAVQRLIFSSATAAVAPAKALSSSSSDSSSSGSSNASIGASSSGSSQSAPSAPAPVPKLTVTDQPAVVQQWVRREVTAAGVTSIGLDTESEMVPYAPNILALVQIATPRAVLLVRVRHSKTLVPLLRELLEDERVTKYSIGPEDELERRFDVNIFGHVDVQQRAKTEMGVPRQPGTQEIAGRFAPHLAFVKRTDMQTSNWGAWPLSEEQKRYAADDALVALAVGRAMGGKECAPFRLLSVAAAATTAAAAAVPTAAASSSSLVSPPLKASLSPNEPLNGPQIAAVQGILSGAHHPAPFIVFGPPGTGPCNTVRGAVARQTKDLSCKTKVLCESIWQLLQQSPSNRILAVAPSNAAADLFVERLKNMDRSQMFRLNAVSRQPSGVSDTVRRFSRLNDDGFQLLRRDELRAFRVVVSTAVSGSCLSGLGLLPGDFTHIVIDEAGHATEPEAAATLGGLIDHERTRIVLGGDPQQLGPIIRNAHAIKFGLGVSLLERLIREADTHPNSPYRRVATAGANGSAADSAPYNPRFMVKLLHNYRSHPSILAVPNKLFYNNELLVAAEVAKRQSLCTWPGWPNGNRSCPLLLHHVQGVEQREADSPSWFNLSEASLVIQYVEQLLEHPPFGLSLADIGVITPYNRQAQKLRTMAKLRETAGKAKWDKSGALMIGSVEMFQGQERRVILLSTVRSQLQTLESFDVKFQLGFVRQPKRLNVALTRAKQALIVVGNANVLETDPNWMAFMRHCADSGAVVGGWKPKASAEDQSAASESSSSSSSSSAASAPADPDEVGLSELLAMAQSSLQQQSAAAPADSDSDDGDWEHVRQNAEPEWKGDE